MEETNTRFTAKTKFIVEIHKGSGGQYTIIMVIAPIAAIVAGACLHSIEPIIGITITMTLFVVPFAYVTYKMFNPDEFRLSFNEGTVKFFKNKTAIASCAAPDLDIKLLKVKETNWGEHCHLLDVIVRFPSGKKQKFRVEDKRVVVTWDMESSSSTGLASTTASSQHVQYLLNFYKLNHIIRFENHYPWFHSHYYSS